MVLTLGEACKSVLETADPQAKLMRARSVARDWRLGRLEHRFDAEMPDFPARPDQPELLAPRFMPKRFSWQEGSQIVIGMTGAAKTGAFLFAFFLAFMPFGGSGYPEGMTMTGQMIAQLIAILAVAGWSIFGTLVAALSVSLLLPMRDANRAD